MSVHSKAIEGARFQCGLEWMLQEGIRRAKGERQWTLSVVFAGCELGQPLWSAWLTSGKGLAGRGGHGLGESGRKPAFSTARAGVSVRN